MEKTHILLSSPTMHEEEMKFIQEAFDKNWVSPLGFNCTGFEDEMVQYMQGCGYNGDLYGLSLSAGTAALHLAGKLAGIKRGDKVFCSDMTFSATVNPVSYEGGDHVFIDSEYDTWNMDPKALEKAFEKYPDTKIVFLVHLYGTPAKMDEIRAICDAHGAILVEDAAEALSSTYKEKPCGTFGDYGVLSFNGNKIITTSGGGMLLTKDKTKRDKALFWATQSREKAPWYQHEEIGYNYRMSNIVAGIGRGQLLHVEEHRKRKEEIYLRYKEAFQDLPLTMNPYLPDTKPNFWLSCILLNKGVQTTFMDLYNALAEDSIDSRPIWKPMHMQPVFAGHDFISVSEQPVDEDIFSRGLCLPSDIKMTKDEQERVINVVRKTLEASH